VHATLPKVLRQLRYHYVFVGMSDCMLDSVHMLAALLGWPPAEALNFSSVNINTRRLQVNEA
jgi:hypothetical protein